jgi:hypothetical protein
LFFPAVRTPSSPELEQDDLPFCRLVGVSFARERFGVKTRSGLSLLVGCKTAGRDEEQDGGEEDEQAARKHGGGNISQVENR